MEAAASMPAPASGASEAVTDAGLGVGVSVGNGAGGGSGGTGSAGGGSAAGGGAGMAPGRRTVSEAFDGLAATQQFEMRKTCRQVLSGKAGGYDYRIARFCKILMTLD